MEGPRGVPTKIPDGVDGAALGSERSLLCSPWGARPTGDCVAGAPPLRSPEPNPTPNPGPEATPASPADPGPLKPGRAASCRGSGCPWGPEGS